MLRTYPHGLLNIFNNRTGFSFQLKMIESTAPNRFNSLRMLRYIPLVIICLAFSGRLQAQDITELSLYITQQKASQDTLISHAALHLEDLLTDVQSTVYIGSTLVAKGLTAPVRADVKASSVSKLLIDNSLFSQVEIISVRLRSSSDLNFLLDLQRLTTFPKLKYLYFLCEFDCTTDDLTKLFRPKTGITVLYKISIAS